MISATWNNETLTAEAKADLLCNSIDITRWEHQFIPALGEGGIWNEMQFGGVEMESDQGELTLEAGEWRISQNTGDYNASGNNVSFYVDGSLQYIFADPGLAEEFLLSIPYGQTKTVKALQTQGRFATALSVIQMQGYNTPGDNPQVSAAGDQLTVTLGSNGNTPRNGVLTATPKVFSAAGAEVAAGNSISLIVNLSSSGGC